MGIHESVGRLVPGTRADILVVEGDPLKDIASLARVRAVISGGRLAHGQLS
jgi:imidazolonepropionase-like amidohydrolase